MAQPLAATIGLKFTLEGLADADIAGLELNRLEEALWERTTQAPGTRVLEAQPLTRAHPHSAEETVCAAGKFALPEPKDLQRRVVQRFDEFFVGVGPRWDLQALPPADLDSLKPRPLDVAPRQRDRFQLGEE